MESELNQIEELLFETMAFVARKAQYRDENVAEAVGKFLSGLESILPRATVNAFQEAMNTKVELDAARKITREHVLREAEKLSRRAAEFGEDLEAINKVIFSAVQNSAVLEETVTKKSRSQQDILDHFGIKPESSAVVDNEKGNSKDQSINL